MPVAARLALVTVMLLITAGCQRAGHDATDRLHPCGISEGPPDAFCGTYTVFENRAAKSGRTIALKIVVAPALRRNPRPDPLFVFEGGPGGGAATLASERIPMFRRYQTDRDIVLIDQRGTGDSNPLDCGTDDADADLDSIENGSVERFRACLAKLQADAKLYTTSLAMDDIDDVRRFLGYGEINLWGGSYGTRAALVYLKQHESAVRSAVLDGVAPPDMRIPLFMARDGQRALDRLLDDCEHDTGGCAAAYPHLRRSVAKLWDDLSKRPRVTFTHPRTGQPRTITVSQRLIASILFQALYSPEITALVPRLLTDAADGNFQGLFALAYSADVPKGGMSEGLFLSVVCAEDMPRISPDDIARETEGRFFGTAMFDIRMKPCEFWPRAPVADDYYEPVRSSKPVLLLSGEDDPVTPPSWGEHVAQSLANAKHVVVPGAGHITLMRGCVRDLVGTFLDSANPGAVDASCVGELRRPPFFTTYTGPDPHR